MLEYTRRFVHNQRKLQEPKKVGSNCEEVEISKPTPSKKQIHFSGLQRNGI